MDWTNIVIKHLGGFGMESLGPAAWKMSLMSVDPISGALPGGHHMA